MKISILGGTGGLGQGLALRWIQYHDIIVGSRLKQKADETAKHKDYKAEIIQQISRIKEQHIKTLVFPLKI